MGSPDVPGQGEPPDPEPPYRPWPGEQLPYTPSTDSAADWSEPGRPPRRRQPWLRAAAVLVAVVGISTGAVLFTQSGDNGSTGGSGGSDIETIEEPTTPDDTGPGEDEPTDDDTYTTEPVEPPTDIDEPSESDPELEPETTYVDDLSVGDCVDETESSSYVLIVPCDAPHDMQTLAVIELEDGYEYPGDDALDDEAESLCYDAYSDAEENWTVEEEEALMWDKVVPDSDGWEAGDRTVVCFVESLYEEPLEEDWLGYSSY